MPLGTEIRVIQKTNLFKFLKLKKDNDEKNIDVIGLDVMIMELKTAMEQEDVALVEKILI